MEKKETVEENQTIKEIGREVAGAFYDYQAVRLSSMNRIRDVIRKRSEGIAFDAVEKKIDKEKKTYDKKYNDKALPSTINKMKEEGKITDKEYDYIQKSLKLSDESQKIEAFYKTMMMEYVQQEPDRKSVV
jgi:glutamyl-tRNA reductase